MLSMRILITYIVVIELCNMINDYIDLQLVKTQTPYRDIAPNQVSPIKVKVHNGVIKLGSVIIITTSCNLCGVVITI